MINYVDDLLKNINDSKLIVSKFLSLEEQILFLKYKNKVIFPENCERKRIIFNEINFDISKYISIIKIEYNEKYGDIGHRDVLGALIALGIKRECIGDIIIDDNVYVYIIKEMENYIVNNLMQIGRISVNVTISNFEDIADIKIDNYIEDQIIVSSYRLDAVIAERCSMSREKAKQYVVLKNIKINGIINSNPDYIVKIDDLISIHRFGRLIIKEELKKTKKDKYILRVLKTK